MRRSSRGLPPGKRPARSGRKSSESSDFSDYSGYSSEISSDDEPILPRAQKVSNVAAWLQSIVDGSERRVENFQLGDYVCQNRPLGEGAFGKVFKCSSRGDPNQVFAIKALKVKDQKSLQQIQREVELLRKISSAADGRVVCHPLLTCLHDFFQIEDHYFMILDFFDGYELFEVMSTITLQETVAVMRTIASAVVVLHRAGVCHRDLKPENILFNRETMRLSVIDVGLSCDVCPETRYIGTAVYIPPEGLVSTPTAGYPSNFKVCTKADVFALGVMLFEMCRNEVFPGNGEADESTFGLPAPYTEDQIEMMSERVEEADEPLRIYEVLEDPEGIDPNFLPERDDSTERRIQQHLAEISMIATKGDYTARISMKEFERRLNSVNLEPEGRPRRGLRVK